MSCGREARAVPRLHQPKHTPHCVDAATNANDSRHLCDRCRSGRQRLRREPGGKVTRDHSDVEAPQDRSYGFKTDADLARCRMQLDLARLRRRSASGGGPRLGIDACDVLGGLARGFDPRPGSCYNLDLVA